ncbi:MAG: hypothetical protein BRD31_05530 [Bacteroidetes bacterium QH_2_64_26]|nr:MAG: hypothetical protein BRD27_00895 [Bacteroidetes bacterium QH_10_64_19]PSQ69483.1 MAG: hypothetical protein BRD31_05530 [Bacteroidetes bacterium QH_2_64_26]
MLGRLILLFLLTPAIELALLIQVDRFIGFWPTIGLIIVTGIVGSHLARREGLSTWQRLNERLQRGDLPGAELADGVIILVAGALLITPGILTDVIGFVGLIPFTRRRIRGLAMRWFRRKMEKGSMQVQFGVFGGWGPSSPNTPPNFSQGPDSSSSETDWQGRSQDLPSHADDSSPGPSDDPDASSS